MELGLLWMDSYVSSPTKLDWHQLMAPVPQPESSEKLTWNPKEIGVDLNTLEISYDHGKAKQLRVLRYAIQLQMREVGTKYWVKTWSWTKPYRTKGRVRQILSSEPSDREALFTSQEISRNLAVSYDLGPGMKKEVCTVPFSFPCLNLFCILILDTIQMSCVIFTPVYLKVWRYY
jgi:hypothetical protein